MWKGCWQGIGGNEEIADKMFVSNIQQARLLVLLVVSRP